MKVKNILVMLLIFLVGCSSLEERERDNFTQECYIQEKVPRFQERERENIPYFSRVDDGSKKIKTLGCDEGRYLELFKDRKIKGIGDSSPYWRWEVEFSKKNLETILNENIYNLKKSNRTAVYFVKNGKWDSGNIGKNPVGKLEKITVLKRGLSGVARELLVKGSRGTYLITKEYNIRKVLAFNKFEGKKGDIYLKGKDGKNIGKNMSMLPSGFFAPEIKGNVVKIYGGGFGHGVGMPQWGARDLAEKRKFKYDDILERYYPKTSLSRASRVIKNADSLLVLIGQGGTFEQQNIKLISPVDMSIRVEGKNHKIKKDTQVEFNIRNGILDIKSSGKVLAKTKEQIIITSKGKIGVRSNLKKHLKKGYPEYYGDFIIRPYGTGRMLLINRVNLEDYLKGVLPSEMPQSFGLEALKAQAVSSRTYAVSAVLGNKYSKYGVNLVDSVSSQVYNN
ncbi:MAG: SpoIID/LytB domain-containing protein, partial [Fusobacteriaceae bacterium]